MNSIGFSDQQASSDCNIYHFIPPLSLARGGLLGAGKGPCGKLGRDLPRKGVHLREFLRASVGLPHHPTTTGEQVRSPELYLSAL